VAIVGWITPDTSFTAANAGSFGFDPVVPSVRKCITELKKEHPDVHMIIGLSHTGAGGCWLGWVGSGGGCLLVGPGGFRGLMCELELRLNVEGFSTDSSMPHAPCIQSVTTACTPWFVKF